MKGFYGGKHPLSDITENPFTIISQLHYRSVLDHGYVKLLDMMGDDWSPVKAARVSYGDSLKGPEADKKLLRYLLKHNHTSPFEQVELQWEVKLPLFVKTEWDTHRTANRNGFSMRYADPSKLSENGEIEFYKPILWRQQDDKNKQGSTEAISNPYHDKLYAELCENSAGLYRHYIKNGVAREMARMVLPVSAYTKMIWKNDLWNTWHFLKLRMADNAQWEIRQYANAMHLIMKDTLPVLMELWDENNGQ